MRAAAGNQVGERAPGAEAQEAEDGKRSWVKVGGPLQFSALGETWRLKRVGVCISRSAACCLIAPSTAPYFKGQPQPLFFRWGSFPHSTLRSIPIPSNPLTHSTTVLHPSEIFTRPNTTVSQKSFQVVTVSIQLHNSQ